MVDTPVQQEIELESPVRASDPVRPEGVDKPAPFVLTPGQEAGFQTFINFYTNPDAQVMVLKGWSGTGKSTLIRRILDEMESLDRALTTLDDNFEPFEPLLTATTNQACDALAVAMKEFNHEVKTIHRALGLRLRTDYKTGKSELMPISRFELPYRCLIVVDEASYIDPALLQFCFDRTDCCKFIFVGDDCQLTPVGTNIMPAFAMKDIVVELTEVKRQNSGPLLDLCNAFRHTVKTGEWPKIQLDGDQLIHVPRDKFVEMAEDAFQHPEVHGNTKVLAYTNACVTEYNKHFSKLLLGSSDPQIGQKMLVNEAVINKHAQLSNGSEVVIEDIRPAREFDVDGFLLKLMHHSTTFFLPKSLKDRKDREKLARKMEDYKILQLIDQNWVDLRPSFSCTVNKSQGSTYDTVFIDLDNICGKVHRPNALARLLYVGFSRARRRVVMTGDM
ncbi:putative DNA helicase [Pseudomonas phage Pa2]|nr:putative DNA helicase [Pseudomonas phage Pa2]AIZ94878.2 putative DNA helicase [Pseudomonas phage Pa2]